MTIEQDLKKKVNSIMNNKNFSNNQKYKFINAIKVSIHTTENKDIHDSIGKWISQKLKILENNKNNK